MKRVPLIAAVLVLSVAATIAAAEFGWLGGAGASSQREVRDLVSGQPVARALVVVVDSYRPPLASLFASADPRRCRTIDFVRGDDAGRLPDGIQGGVAFVLAPGVQGLAPYLSPIQTGDAYALSAQRLQGGEGAEQFGPGYATESAAAAAREAFLASPEGREYSAFSVRPEGAGEFRNFRQLQVKWIELARGAQRYPDLAAADQALRSHAWTLPGPADLTGLREALDFCHDAHARGLERAGPLLDALEHSNADADRTPDAQQTLAHWRTRVGR